MGERVSSERIHKLSANQRAVLIMHIDGPIEFNNENRHLVIARNAMLSGTVPFLMAQPTGTLKPRKTQLSVAGREALGAILGEAADMLIRSGLTELTDPLARLFELREQCRPIAAFEAEPA